jgi:hypothetical protein
LRIGYHKYFESQKSSNKEKMLSNSSINDPFLEFNENCIDINLLESVPPKKEYEIEV